MPLTLRIGLYCRALLVNLADEDLKWISWPEYLELCAELRRECGAIALDDNKRDDVKRRRRRPDAAVAWSVQKYLIFAILSCVPDRQVSEFGTAAGYPANPCCPASCLLHACPSPLPCLPPAAAHAARAGGGAHAGQGPGGAVGHPPRAGRLQGECGLSVGLSVSLPACVPTSSLACRLHPPPLQTGRAYGERPPLVLSPHLYPELEEFMGRWRAALHPQHDFLFTA